MKGKGFSLTSLEPKERDILAAILTYLKLDRRVAWFERMNTGSVLITEDTGKEQAFVAKFEQGNLFNVSANELNQYRRVKGKIKKSQRYVKFSFPGCSDIIGQMVDGRFLAIEVKSLTGKATKQQLAFIDSVNKANGLGFIARSVEDVKRQIDNDTC